MYPVLTTLPIGFSWAVRCSSVKMSRTTVLSRSADSSLLICRDHSTPPLLSSEHGMGSLGFRWSYADHLRVLDRGENCTEVHLARLIAGVKGAGLEAHDIFTLRCSLVVRCHQPTRIAVEQASG